MKTQFPLGLATILIAVAMALSACGDDSKTNTTTGEASGTPPASTTPPPSAVETTIAQCDQYLTRMRACVSTKISETEQQHLNQSLQKLQEMMAQTPDREQLQQQCQGALDNIAEELKSYGCSV